MTLCKGCNELEIDPRTYSGADGFCGEVCRVLSEFAAERRAERASAATEMDRFLSGADLTLDLASTLLGLQKVKP